MTAKKIFAFFVIKNYINPITNKTVYLRLYQGNCIEGCENDKFKTPSGECVSVCPNNTYKFGGR